MTTKAITNKQKRHWARWQLPLAVPGGSSAIKLQRLSRLKKQHEFNYHARTTIIIWHCNDVLKYFWWHSLALCSARALFSSHSYPDAEGHHKCSEGWHAGQPSSCTSVFDGASVCERYRGLDLSADCRCERGEGRANWKLDLGGCFHIQRGRNTIQVSSK